eukprot:ANDGO_07797.mRNA.1 Phosphatidylinositol 4-phosphate 5-kinase 4
MAAEPDRVASKHVRYPNSDVPFIYWRGVSQTRYVNRNDILFNRPGTFILKLKDPYGQYQTRMVYEGGVKVWEAGGRWVFRQQQAVREGTWKDSLRNAELFMTSGGTEGNAATGERLYFLSQIMVPHGQGVLKRADGSVVYEGSWKDGNRDGSGDGEYEDGRYFGEWSGGSKDGDGVYTARTGETVSGKWVEDLVFDAQGTLRKKDGEVWKGEWRSAYFKGIVVYASGDKYEGEVTPPRWIHAASGLQASPNAIGLGAAGQSAGSGNSAAALVLLQQQIQGLQLSALNNAASGSGGGAGGSSQSAVITQAMSGGLNPSEDESELLQMTRSIWDRVLIPGSRQGPGKETLVTGGTYVGYWQDGKRHGFGTFQWPDKNTDQLFYSFGNLLHMRSAAYAGGGSGGGASSGPGSGAGDSGVNSATVDVLSREMEVLRAEKKHYAEEAQSMMSKHRENLERMAALERDLLVMQAERDTLRKQLDEETTKRSSEEHRRKAAEVFIERLDEEMKNLQQVQQRRIQARLDEARRSMDLSNGSSYSFQPD